MSFVLRAGCKRGRLPHGLGGGCWYPLSESYSAWRKKPQGRPRLKPQALARRNRER